MKRSSKTLIKPRDLRPTTGKVREALFDILRGKVKDSRFLDLYAGTGAVGIDALREGASEVVFVEKSVGYSNKIKGLIDGRTFAGKAVVMNKKALSFIEWAESGNMTFDIIFLDPPYHTEEISLALIAIDGSNILDKGGTVIAEHFSKRELPENFDTLQKIKDYNYGDSILSVYVLRASHGDSYD